MVDTPRGAPRPYWLTPLVVLLLGVAIGLAMIVGGTALLIYQYNRNTDYGYRPSAQYYAVLQAGNALVQAGTILFSLVFAIQGLALVRAHREAARRRLLLGALGRELGLLGGRDEADRVAHYRDPIRLTMPARVLDGTALEPARDGALVAALLELQHAVARYNETLSSSPTTATACLPRGANATGGGYKRRAKRYTRHSALRVGDHGPPCSSRSCNRQECWSAGRGGPLPPYAKPAANGISSRASQVGFCNTTIS